MKKATKYILIIFFKQSKVKISHENPVVDKDQ